MSEDEQSIPSALKIWPALPAIALAAGAYSIVGVVFAFLVLINQAVLSFSDIATVIYATVIYAFLAGVLGIVYGWFAGAVAMILMSSFLWSTGLQIAQRQASSLAGGMTGYWSIALPVSMMGNEFPQNEAAVGKLIVFVFFGPITAMAFGYIGARLYSPKGWIWKLSSSNAIPSKHAVETKSKNAHPKFQLDLKALFGLVMWAALITAFVQGIGSSSEIMWIAIGIYVIFQSLIVVVDVLLSR